MSFDEFKTLFKKNIKKFNIDLQEDQYKQFYEYMNILISWNKKINLTAITKPEDIVVKHFIDSLTIKKHIKENSRVIDIGTGAGFPRNTIKDCTWRY